jgi:hypothetical protein
MIFAHVNWSRKDLIKSRQVNYSFNEAFGEILFDMVSFSVTHENLQNYRGLVALEHAWNIKAHCAGGALSE